MKMELRIKKDWLAQHREEDEGHDISAGSLMLKLVKEHPVDSTDPMIEAVEESRDEVSEKLKLFPKEQRFRLVTLPRREDTDSLLRSTPVKPYASGGLKHEPAHVAEGAEEYHVAPGTEGKSDETGC
jgi:hypothetical protein